MCASAQRKDAARLLRAAEGMARAAAALLASARVPAPGGTTNLAASQGIGGVPTGPARPGSGASRSARRRRRRAAVAAAAGAGQGDAPGTVMGDAGGGSSGGERHGVDLAAVSTARAPVAHPDEGGDQLMQLGGGSVLYGDLSEFSADEHLVTSDPGVAEIVRRAQAAGPAAQREVALLLASLGVTAGGHPEVRGERTQRHSRRSKSGRKGR